MADDLSPDVDKNLVVHKLLEKLVIKMTKGYKTKFIDNLGN